jgi:RimJ/RimL family protein N-acetyltransferase
MSNNLDCSENSELRLRCISIPDLEKLRNWKNSNKISFYFQEEITFSMQEEWYRSYITRPDDHMYIVEYRSVDIGCMGIRLTGASWDIYNVILGEKEYGGKRIMSRALTTIIKFAQSSTKAPISLKVLQTNSATLWYQRQGFVIKEALGDSYYMELNQTELWTSTK